MVLDNTFQIYNNILQLKNAFYAPAAVLKLHETQMNLFNTPLHISTPLFLTIHSFQQALN